MNWEIIISAIVGMLTGGGVSWLFKLKDDKASSQSTRRSISKRLFR